MSRNSHSAHWEPGKKAKFKILVLIVLEAKLEIETQLFPYPDFVGLHDQEVKTVTVIIASC